MEQRDSEQKGSACGTHILRCYLAADWGIHQGKRAEETAGRMSQLWMLPVRSAQTAPGSKLRCDPGRKPYYAETYKLSVGAMKQAHPSRKHMQAGVGRVKNGQGVRSSALTVELVLHGE